MREGRLSDRLVRGLLEEAGLGKAERQQARWSGVEKGAGEPCQVLDPGS